MKSRKLIHPHELKILPVGAIVANGYQIGEEWLFQKNLAGRWMMYDPKTHDTSRHAERIRKDWGAELGFEALNLPVYLLSEKGSTEEFDHWLPTWRKHKLDWLAY